jgi:protein arginine kinase activator
MGENMQCQLCGDAATVHLTQIVNNQIQKVDLCESCAEEKGVTQPDGFSLADMLIQIGAGEESAIGEGAVSSCPGCGLSAVDFKKSGRFGCAKCYDHFRTLLEPLLGNMHAGPDHKGKVPAGLVDRQQRREAIEELERQLEAAVETEDYEEAARHRDAIKQLQAEEASTES